MPAEWWDWRLAREFPGWTLEYIRSLSVGDFHDWIEIEEARHTAAKVG